MKLNFKTLKCKTLSCLFVVLALFVFTSATQAEDKLNNLLNFQESGFRVDLFQLDNKYQLRISPSPEAEKSLGLGVDSLKTFFLSKPSRFVIDVPGILATKSYVIKDVATQDIKSLRIGLHKEKIRLVLDMTSNEEPKFQIRRDKKSGDFVINLSFSMKDRNVIETTKESSSKKEESEVKLSASKERDEEPKLVPTKSRTTNKEVEEQAKPLVDIKDINSEPEKLTNSISKKLEKNESAVISLKGDTLIEQSKEDLLEKNKKEIKQNLIIKPEDTKKKLADSQNTKIEVLKDVKTVKDETIKTSKEQTKDAVKTAAATGASLSIADQLKKIIGKDTKVSKKPETGKDTQEAAKKGAEIAAEKATKKTSLDAPIKELAATTSPKKEIAEKKAEIKPILKEKELIEENNLTAKKPESPKIIVAKESPKKIDAKTIPESSENKSEKMVEKNQTPGKVNEYEQLDTKQNALPASGKNVLKSINFDKQPQDKSTVVILNISSDTKYKIHPSSTKKNLYILLLDNTTIDNIDLNMPQFSPKDLKGFDVVVARKKKDQVVLRLYMKEGYAPLPLRVKGNIWVKAIKN